MNDDSTEADEFRELLTERLKRSPRVRRLAGDSGDVEELATEAANTLIDIQRSTGVMYADVLPRLLATPPGTPEFDDLLDDIAEELRHIHYHIMNTKLFGYVVSAGPQP
jgi:hypothetical protein